MGSHIQEIRHVQQSYEPSAYSSVREEPLSSLGKVAFISLWLLVFVIPWENVMIPGVGTVGLAVGTLASGIAILAIIEKGRLRSLTTGHVLMILFVMWAATSYLWTLDPDFTTKEVPVYLRLLLMVWLIWQLLPDAQHQIGLLQAYVFGTLVPSIDTIVRFMNHKEAAYLRYAGAGSNPDDLGLIMALSVPISYYLLIRSGRRKAWFYLAQLLLAGTSLLLSAARGGFLAVAVALTIVPLTAARLKWRQKMAILLTVALFISAAAMLVPANSWDRLSTIPNELRAGDLSGRRSIWAAGLEVFREHPFLGVGAGAYLPSVRHILVEPNVAHNTFLSVLVELGVIGLGIFCALLAFLLLSAKELPWLPKRVWLVCIAVWLVGVSTLSWEARKPTWLLFGLLLSQNASLSHKARRNHAPAVPLSSLVPNLSESSVSAVE
jgi:O-antigen ligase